MDKGSHDYYRAKWTGKKWLKTYLGNGGGHFHQTPGLEKCYSAGMAMNGRMLLKRESRVTCLVDTIRPASSRVYFIIS